MTDHNGQTSPEQKEAQTQRENREEPTLLVSIRDGLEAGMMEALLEEAGIPVLRKYPETGQVLHMVMGTSLYGTELHVPWERLEEARALLASIDGTGTDMLPQAGPVEAEVLLRPMENTDWLELEKLWTDTPGVGLRFPDDSAEGLEKYLRRNPTTSFVAERDGGLVGSILAGHDGRRGYLYHVAVTPAQRRHGIGRALVMSSVQALQDEGIRKAGLVVFSGNEEGNLFWDALGWKRRTDLMYRDSFLTEGEM